MAVRLSVGRKLSITSIVVLGLAVVAGTVPYLIDLGPEAGTAPEPRAAAAAPEPSSTENRAAEVAAIAEIRIENQAGTTAEAGAGQDAEAAAPAEPAPAVERTAEAAAPAEPAPAVERTAEAAAPAEPAPAVERTAEAAAIAQPVEPRDQPAASPAAAVEPVIPPGPAVVAGPAAEPMEPAESPAVVASASPLAEAVPDQTGPSGNPALRSRSEKTSGTAQAIQSTGAAQTAQTVQTVQTANATASAAETGSPDRANGAEASAPALRPAVPQPSEAQPAATEQSATEKPAAFQVGITVARLMTEPRDSAGPAARRKNMAPLPVRAPRPAGAGAMAAEARTMFERGVAIEVKRDANVYITSRNIPRNDRLLEAYNADRPNGGRVQTNLGEAAAVPGLLGIAAQAQRGQGGQTYSLADAMRDAIWRKKTAARLKSLTTAQNACAKGTGDTARSAPSIGLPASC